MPHLCQPCSLPCDIFIDLPVRVLHVWLSRGEVVRKRLVCVAEFARWEA